MHTTSVVVALLFTLVGGCAPLSRTAPALRETPSITVFGASADQEARFDLAVARFASNELRLPELEVHFHESFDACDGHLGLFRASVEPAAIHICSDLDFVLTHELAHAWTSHNLDSDDRRRYLDHRGLAVWNDTSTPWKHRGTEDAAFIIQQNLMTEAAPPRSPTWSERIEAYQVLTGQVSPLRTEPESMAQNFLYPGQTHALW